MRSSFSNVRKDVQKVKQTIEDRADDWDRIKDITDNSGNIVLGKLNSLTQIASKIVNSTGTFVQGDSFMMWHDQPTEDASTFATKWSAQGLVFANNKDANGDWVWQTALGADGLIATDVSASCLNAITANIINLVVDSLTGKTIKGCTFLGGEIWIGTNVPDDGNTSNYTGMVITKRGDIDGYIRGKLSYTLSHNSEGRLILRDEDKSLYMDSANTRIYSTGSALELMGGIPTYDVNNTLINSRIKIKESNGDIYLVANRGLGTVYVTGDLVVSGKIDN